jgi:hypothetical protein
MVQAGLAASAAILVRPNLVPLAGMVGLFLLFRPERTWHQRSRDAAAYAACCVPGCAGVALVQWTFYGSPLLSGYGPVETLFSSGNVASNLRRYLPWLWQTHSPLIAAAALAPFLLPGPLAALFVAMFLVNLALYLPYTVFEDWSFIRFLLPTLPLVLILVLATLDAAWRRLRLPGRNLALGVAVVAWSAFLVLEARDRGTFRLQSIESRFERTGTFVGERLPSNAIVMAGWQSGSVRFYARRRTITWHGLDPAWLDRAIDHLRGRGYEPYLLLERWEEPEFRTRFASSPLGALDWPPAFEIASQVRIYRPGDRARFLNGSAAPTEYVR